jgi:hypothetical protein
MSIPLSSATLGNYITAVRDLLNQPDAANSFWSDQELTRYLNEGIRLYFLEVTNNNEGYWTKIADLDIVNGVETVALPSDCYQIKTVHQQVNQGYVVLPYRNDISQSYSTQGGQDSNTYFPSYFFRENNLVLRPVPNYSATGTLRVQYIYFPDVLQQAGDTMPANMLPIFRQVIEMYAVYKAKMKESLVNGVDTSALAKQNLGDLYSQFKAVVQERSKYPQFIKAWSAEDSL